MEKAVTEARAVALAQIEEDTKKKGRRGRRDKEAEELAEKERVEAIVAQASMAAAAAVDAEEIEDDEEGAEEEEPMYFTVRSAAPLAALARSRPRLLRCCDPSGCIPAAMRFDGFHSRRRPVATTPLRREG